MSKNQVLQEQLINHFLETKEGVELIEYYSLKIITYLSDSKPCVIVFQGNSKKPRYRYFFGSIESRFKFIESIKKHEYSKVKEKEKRAEEIKNYKPNVKVGDIFVSTWGYEQTNVDFYVVTEVVGKKSVLLQKIGKESVKGSEGHDCDKVVADASYTEGEPFKKVLKLGDVVSLNSYSYCKKWDGQPEYRSWYY